MKTEQLKVLLDLIDGMEKAQQPTTEAELPLDCPWSIGKNYFIRTVTHHHTGRLVAVTQQELLMENAAWIANDGRFEQAVASGEFDEVEMFPKDKRIIIGRGSVIDAVELEILPTSQK